MLLEIQSYLKSNPELLKRREVILHFGDMTDPSFILSTIAKSKPDEIYNLAAQSHVAHSFNMAHHTYDVNLLGLENLCSALLTLEMTQKVKLFHASTSEMFGQVDAGLHDPNTLIDENFPFNPKSPYAVSKISNFYMVKYYREVYKMFICTAIAFNHESPLRHDEFITRKLTKAAARIKHGLQQTVRIGNMYAKRDWGHS